MRILLSLVFLIALSSVAYADTITFTYSGVGEGSTYFYTVPQGQFVNRIEVIGNYSVFPDHNLRPIFATLQIENLGLVSVVVPPDGPGGFGQSGRYDLNLVFDAGSLSQMLFGDGNAVFHVSQQGVNFNASGTVTLITSTSPVAAPEPASILLISTGLFGALLKRKFKHH